MSTQSTAQFKTLSARVMETALLFPDKPALHVENTYYSYRELGQLIKNCCALLPPDIAGKRVAVYCTGDMYTYVSILALNLMGATYVPLNAKFPVERNKRILALAAVDLILSSSEDFALKVIAGSSLVIDSKRMSSDSNFTTVEMKSVEKDLTVTILFTSGSTGEPKGVPVSLENVNAFFDYFLNAYDFNASDKFLQVYELTFDVSVFSLFMPLLVGACCYVLPDEGSKPVQIVKSLQQYKITVLSMVPSVLHYLERYFSEIQLPALRYSFFSGDALLHTLAKKWQLCLSNGAIHNFYGPTETTIVCTRYIFDAEKSAQESLNNIVPLGKAFEGMDYLIVDEQLNSVAEGELCFSGKQVIKAYLNKSNEDCFFEHKGKRYYKTGDIVSEREKIGLLFHGRKDQQVKINGYRVELVEIKNALQQLTGSRAEVFFENGLLMAFVESIVDETKLKNELEQTLPLYMIPNKISGIKNFPMNENGKVDRKKIIVNA